MPFFDLSVCFDSLGAQYCAPRWAFSTPAGVVSDDEFRRASARAGARRGEYSGPPGELPGLVCRISATGASGEQDVRLGSGGCGGAAPGGALSNGSTVLALKAALQATLLSGRADQAADANTPHPNRWAASGGLPPARQRIMFRGRELADDAFLHDAGLTQGAVLQVFVRPQEARVV